MSETPLPADARKGNPVEPFADALAAARQRVQGFLSAQRERIARIQADLADQARRYHERLEQRRVELDSRQGEIDTAEEQVRRRGRSATLAGHEQEAELEHLQELRRRLDQRASELDSRQERLAAAQARTESQRRRIADELHARRLSLFNVLQRHQDELETLSRESEPARRSLESETPDWLRRPDPNEEVIRQLREQNAALEERVVQLQSSILSTSASEPPAASWELQKQRLLASLENEGLSSDGHRSTERLKIEEVIHTTDETLRDKDREIREIRAVLQDQSGKVNDMAIGAAALGQLVDSDPLINEQREHLQKMQEHWEEMLRQAEIELSMERAKLARDRAEIDEKLRTYEQQSPRPENETSPATSDKPAHSRWLARLGLIDPH